MDRRVVEIDEGSFAMRADVADTERRLKACFAYDKINYLMLMMVDPHVHFHVIPRYGECREIYGLEWVDRAWPKPPDLWAGPIDAAVLERIRQDIQRWQ